MNMYKLFIIVISLTFFGCNIKILSNAIYEFKLILQSLIIIKKEDY